MKSKNFKIDPYFINAPHRITISVIGAGGNGSLIMTKLARLCSALRKMDHPGFHVTLIDADIVEAKNEGRQMFTKQDVGSFKADCIVSKINHSFGFDWDCDNEMFTKKNNFHVLNNIVICAVDNVKSRKLILEEFYFARGSDTNRPFYLIDCGNARDFGQVIFCDQKKELKNFFDYFPEAKKKETIKIQGRSCSYAESLQEQDLFINDWVSLHAVNLIKKLMFEKQIDYQGVVFNTDSLDSVKMKI